MFTYIKALAGLLLPRRCALCGSAGISTEDVLCPSCRAELPLTWFWQRRRNPMSDALNAAIEQRRALSGDDYYEPYAYACALFFYKGPYREITKQLKYNGIRRPAMKLAGELAEVLAATEHLADVDVVVPVPLHWTRRLVRGYNQAEVIAAVLAEGLGAAVRSDLLRRSRRTRSQAVTSTAEKASNVSGAFAADVSGLLPVPDAVLPRHILLVDDVFTTGSTLAECHRALRRSLVCALGTKKAATVKISVATLAFTGE